MTKQFAFNLLSVLLLTCLLYECRQEVLSVEPVSLEALPQVAENKDLPGFSGPQALICKANTWSDCLSGRHALAAYAAAGGKWQAGVAIQDTASQFMDNPYPDINHAAPNKMPPALRRVLRAQELATPQQKSFISLFS